MDPHESPGTIPDLLARSYMFCRVELVRQGAWSTLIKDHITQHYEGIELNSKRTNIKRSFANTDSFSWETYYEALVVLSRVTSELKLTISLDTGNHIESYRYTIESDRKNWTTKKGHPIKPDNKNAKSLFMPANQNREDETVFTYIIREAMRKQRITVEEMNKRLNEFIKDPINIVTYSVTTPANMKSSLKASLCRGSIAWNNVPRLLKLLGYRNLTLKLEARTGVGVRSSVVGLDL